MQGQAKHKLCRRVGACVWNDPKCPSVKRPYPAGQHGKTGRRRKLSTHGELLIEKQKLKTHYAISEKQLTIAYKKAKKGEGQTDEKLIQSLEMRLDAVVFRAGLAPTIFAAKQFVNHRHVLVDGKIVDRSSYKCREGQVVCVDPSRSPAIAEVAQNTNSTPPSYLEVDRDNCKVAIVRTPLPEEIPVEVELMRVIEFYAR